MNYLDYVDLFNTGDDAALVDRYFHDEIVFTGGTRRHPGKEGLLAFLNWAHDGVREVIRLQNFLQQGDLIFADIDMDFHATKERPDFPFGHLYPGDSITVKFFVTYRLKDDRIVELKSMTWPAGRGVTTIPRLGGHPSQVAAFHAYAAAFSHGDFDRFTAFYTDDVTLQLRALPPIRGKQAIADFYRAMFPKVREDLLVRKALADDEAIAIDLTSRFTAIEDAPDFSVMPLARGEAVEVDLYVHYRLRGGLIASIHGVRAGEPVKFASGQPRSS
ncbi:nuclear transport factor 2 family protein [Sphingosinicella sp. CPCC 101087]|uniref:nuclear transport factor 2 family protein n=1 Tax=Sphingosinicella sp. CPCC 101087 TaxID=2497754 RepID=UPI00101D1F04|nr:nuclear transport factor 2 family protein [Sphingosinicella sp. CPCC 101087]